MLTQYTPALHEDMTSTTKCLSPSECKEREESRANTEKSHLCAFTRPCKLVPHYTQVTPEAAYKLAMNCHALTEAMTPCRPFFFRTRVEAMQESVASCERRQHCSCQPDTQSARPANASPAGWCNQNGHGAQFEAKTGMPATGSLEAIFPQRLQY